MNVDTKILLIYTGGTIGMEKDFNSNSLRNFDFENILKRIPELKQIPTQIDIISFKKPIDSSDVGPFHWKILANIIKENYNDFDGFVVLHGTDTMAYSASALSFMIEGLRKPIIFTGSQLPIGDLRTDAKENLISSIYFASMKNEKKPAVKEVCIYFEYKLYRANRTTKMNAHFFDAFKSPNYPYLGESGIHMSVNNEALWKEPKVDLKIYDEFSEKVGLIKIFPGMSNDFLINATREPGIEALIIEAFGNGNIFNREDYNRTIAERIHEGLKIIITTQCLGGGVELGLYEASIPLVEVGAISGKDLTTEAAVTKTMLLLKNKERFPDFKLSFHQNMRGETYD